MDKGEKLDNTAEFAPNGLWTKSWTICFRKIGMHGGPMMNAVCEAYGDDLKEAILYARAHMAHDIGFDWMSPVTKVTYQGKFNLLTMTFDPEDKHTYVKIFDEGLFPSRE